MNLVLLDASTLGGVDTTSLAASGSLTQYPQTQTAHIIERAQHADVVITNKVVIDRTTMAALPNLKLICVAATGTNNIDLIAAKELGISVCNVAGYSTQSVVQHTFSLMFNLLGNTHKYIRDCKQGLWQQSPMFCRLDHSFDELHSKKLGIIGYGELGRAVARIAEAFGMELMIAERRGQAPRPGRLSFDEVIQGADILSLHCPQNESTTGLIDAVQLAKMKPGSLLINTARGGVVDSRALLDALKNGPLAGAALDVLPEEPPKPDDPLASYQGDNLLLTPHIAWASRQSITRLVNEIARNIEAFFNGEERNRVV